MTAVQACLLSLFIIRRGFIFSHLPVLFASPIHVLAFRSRLLLMNIGLKVAENSCVIFGSWCPAEERECGYRQMDDICVDCRASPRLLVISAPIPPLNLSAQDTKFMGKYSI
ncbi:hypothetical protein HYPSUDRAFT_629021 [Hypholoma sublateritium FD-334 SS-4]|uniref:Uncharacterized protein n=1 Tax=Hypholoma sublateritium (strain FD-334 SS-4) TaxID=945553 RepID=A0A0D2LLU1_HYPSF|nr:hypothetical protein HYPSUDRAFT_629021 [Hypholoma sublateritium FD-334 SS-4]